MSTCPLLFIVHTRWVSTSEHRCIRDVNNPQSKVRRQYQNYDCDCIACQTLRAPQHNQWKELIEEIATTWLGLAQNTNKTMLIQPDFFAIFLFYIPFTHSVPMDCFKFLSMPTATTLLWRIYDDEPHTHTHNHTWLDTFTFSGIQRYDTLAL